MSPTDPHWAARLTAPTPPDLVAAERHLVSHLGRSLRFTAETVDGVSLMQARALGTLLLDQLLDELARLDPDLFTAAWHRWVADHARRAGVPVAADLVAQLDGDLADAMGHRPCVQCGIRYVPSTITQRFCSTRCRVAAHRAQQAP